jgi:large subunit ribosomal protein L24
LTAISFWQWLERSDRSIRLKCLQRQEENRLPITDNRPLLGEEMPSLNIHRNDTVKVLTGSDRGKTGRVLRVFPDKGTVLVEHVRVVKKTVSSKQGQRTKGGIAEQESPINVSNVMLVCPTCGPARVGYKVEGEVKVRICKKCGQTLPTKK